MDLIDFSAGSEKNSSKASRSLPPPLLPSVENFEGRLSISGDPFGKVLSQASLYDDPFECAMKTRSASGNSLTTSMCDLESFVQNSSMFFSPNYINREYMFCDISPILNSPNIEQFSLLNNAFLHTSAPWKNSSGNVGEKIAEDFRKRIGSEPVVAEVAEDERKNKSLMKNIEKETAKETEWHSIVAEIHEDLSAETPPLLVNDIEEDSLENLKIPALEHIVIAEEALSGPENVSSAEKPPVNESISEFSEVIDDLRRRMKDVLNRRISPSAGDLDVTDKSPDTPGIVRQETFNIERESAKVSPEYSPEMQKKDCTEETFMEKLKMMCGEHNVSVVQDASQAQENQSMVVVYVNDNSKTDSPSILKRRNSFSSEIPRPATTPNVSVNRRRRSVTATAQPTADLAPREWKCPVGRVLPSPQFRGQQLKIRASEINTRATVGPMRAIRPQPKIQVNENTPPKRVVTKRRSLVATSTPKVDAKKLAGCSTPLVTNKASQKRLSEGPRHFLAENNKFRPRKSFTPSK